MGFFDKIDRILGRKQDPPITFHTVSQVSPQVAVEAPFSFEIVVPEEIQLYFAAKDVEAQSNLNPIGPRLHHSFTNYISKSIQSAVSRKKTDADIQLVREKLQNLKKQFDVAHELYLENIQTIVFDAVDLINQYHSRNNRSILNIKDRFSRHRLEVKSRNRIGEYLSTIIIDLINSVSRTTTDDVVKFKEWGISKDQVRNMTRYISGREMVIAPEHWETYLKLKKLNVDSWENFISLGLALDGLIRYVK